VSEKSPGNANLPLGQISGMLVFIEANLSSAAESALGIAVMASR
jgi:hypothetical protein